MKMLVIERGVIKEMTRCFVISSPVALCIIWCTLPEWSATWLSL
jgi:hypothetical protein